jgi:hypothetical protein
MARAIKDLAELKQLAGGESPLECAIALTGGYRSTKLISYHGTAHCAAAPRKCFHCGRPWYVFNMIDDTTQYLSDRGLWEKSNVGEALDKGALFV